LSRFSLDEIRNARDLGADAECILTGGDFFGTVEEGSMHRRTFLQRASLGSALAWGGCRAGGWPQAPADLEESTVSGLQASMASGQETAASLAGRFLERIGRLDRGGPAVNAVIELNPDAGAIAQALDQERAARGPRGPLHGIPVLLKDNIGTHDRMWTTAGSLALGGSTPPRDSAVAERLRRAGAVILGKTNLSEWANFRSNRSTSGWSARGGLTRNPYALDRNPSGSSSGSAAAVSANLCSLAVGTETDGSIISPASLCGIVGLKPTVGLVSRSGIIPISRSQDTAGPMARTVTDAALLLGALAGVDPEDPVTKESEGRVPADYAASLNPEGLRGARIGVARLLFKIGSPSQKVIEDALRAIRQAGATLVDPADLPGPSRLGDAEFEVLLYEFKAGLNEYLAALGSDAPVRSLKDVIHFNESHREQELRYFGQELLIQAEEKGPLSEKPYREALEKCRRLSREEGIDALMNRHELDAIVAPSGGPAAMTDLVYGDRGVGGSSGPAAIAGYPSITVPAGSVRGLPVGISFFGRAYSEPVLLKLAYGFEQAVKARRAPEFLPTVS
jgi:amidase